MRDHETQNPARLPFKSGMFGPLRLLRPTGMQTQLLLPSTMNTSKFMGKTGRMPWMSSFERNDLLTRIQRLAGEGVFIGTSSWKYPGWSGQLYDVGRYEYRGKFAKTRFERNCLTEYAEVFKTVCVDAAYYTFPSVKYLEGHGGPSAARFPICIQSYG
jgi:hypothetical protein